MVMCFIASLLIVLPVYAQGGLKPEVLCGDNKCGLYEYCSRFSHTCTPCTRICEKDSHNYTPETCHRECQNYLHKDLVSMTPELDKLRENVLMLEVLVGIALCLHGVLFLIFGIYICHRRGKLRKSRLRNLPITSKCNGTTRNNNRIPLRSISMEPISVISQHPPMPVSSPTGSALDHSKDRDSGNVSCTTSEDRFQRNNSSTSNTLTSSNSNHSMGGGGRVAPSASGSGGRRPKRMPLESECPEEACYINTTMGPSRSISVVTDVTTLDT